MGEAEEGRMMGLLIGPVYYFLLDGLAADLFLIYCLSCGPLGIII